MIAIPAIGGVLAALMALIFVLAWTVFGQQIIRLLNVDLPVIGNVLGGLIARTLEVTYDLTLGWLDQYIVPMVAFVARPVTAFATLFESVASGLETTFQAFAQVKDVLIPYAIGTAVTDATNIIVAVRSELQITDSLIVTEFDTALAAEHAYAAAAFTYAGDLASFAINTAETYAGTLYNEALAAVNQAETLAITAAKGFAGEVATYSLGLFNQVLTYAETGITALEGDVVKYYNDALTYADHAATTAAAASIGALTTDVEQVFAKAWTGIRDDVDSVIGVLGTDLPDILVDIQDIPIAIPASIAGAIGLSIPLARTIATYLRECGIPNCRNLSTYGQDLQALLGLVGDASFLAFLVELIHAKGDGYRVVEDAFGGLLNDTVSVARDMLSV